MFGMLKAFIVGDLQLMKALGSEYSAERQHAASYPTRVNASLLTLTLFAFAVCSLARFSFSLSGNGEAFGARFRRKLEGLRGEAIPSAAAAGLAAS